MSGETLSTAGVLERAREELAEHLGSLERYRPECEEVLGRGEANRLSHELGGCLALFQLSDHPVSTLMGKFSAGKTSVISRLLPEALPAGPKATSRLFTIIEPVEGQTQPEYHLARLGSSEARRFLSLLVESLPASAVGRAQEALTRHRDVRETARALGAALVEAYGEAQTPSEKIQLDEAAFLSWSVAERLPEGQECLRLQRLVDAKQAELYVAWGKEPYEPKGSYAGKDALRAALTERFGPQAVEERRRRLGAREASSFEIEQELACLGYLLIRVPATSALVPGTVWADSPGTGNNLHDKIKGRLILEAAVSGALVVPLWQPGGESESTIEAEFAERLPEDYWHATGRIFTYADAVLQGIAKLETLHADGEVAREVVGKFVEHMNLRASPEDVRYRLLDQDDPALAAHVLPVFARFREPGFEDATKRCQLLWQLRAWLRPEEGARAVLPKHLQDLLAWADRKQGPAGAPPCGLEALWEGASARAVARLLGGLVQLATSGGIDGVGPLLRGVQGGVGALRVAQFQRRRGQVEAVLGAVEVGEEAAQSGLSAEQRAAVEEVATAAEEALAQVQRQLNRLGTLRPMVERLLPDEGASGETPRRMLDRILDRARNQLTFDAGRRGGGVVFRDLAVAQFQKMVGAYPDKLEPCVREAVEQSQAVVMDVLRDAFEGSLLESDVGELGAGLRARVVEEARLAERLDALERELGRLLKVHVQDAIRRYWTEAWTQGASPMASLPPDRWLGDVHEAQFRAVADRVVTHRAVTLALNASRLGLAAVKDRIGTALGELRDVLGEDALRRAAEVHFREGSADPAEVRVREARRALRRMVETVPGCLARVEVALGGAS